MNVMQGARSQAINVMLGDEIKARQLYINLAVQAETAQARSGNRNLAVEGVEQLVESGGMTPKQGELEIQRIDATILNGLVFRMLREADSPEEVDDVIVELKDPQGIFHDMDENLRQKALADAERARAFEVKRDKAEVAALKQREIDQRKEQQRIASVEAYEIGHKNQMTSLWVKQNQHRLTGPMQDKFMLWARNGGGILDANEFDSAEHQRLQVLRAEDPIAYSKEELDIEKLGAKLGGHAAAQQEILSGAVPTGQGFHSRVVEWTEGVGGTTAEQTELARLADAEFVEFRRGTGKLADPTQQAAMLDALELRRVRVRQLFGFFPTNVEVLPQDAPIIVEGVPQPQVAQIVDALILRGKGVTREAILRVWNNRE